MVHSNNGGQTSLQMPAASQIEMRTGLAQDLAALEDQGRPIRIGVIGCGEMGTDLVTQIARMKGITIAAMADRRMVNAPQAVEIAGLDQDSFRNCETASDMTSAIEQNRMAVIADAMGVVTHPLVDLVVDATGRPAVGAEIGPIAMQNGKHLVMMNVEADVTIGPYLAAEADKAGVIYSIGAGDEPSSTLELIDFVTALGYPVVAAGKGKNNPLNPYAVPDDYREEAERRNMNPRMLVEFVDGSKTMVEMAAIANATGLVPDIPGMHGPNTSLENLHNVLCPVEDGGVLSKKGCVDFTIGTGVAPGIFVVAELDHPRLRERMNDLKLGPGPYYTFYRPYHLTSLEVPLTCARIALYGRADMQPLRRPMAEVAARAKRDIAQGEILDSIGETCYRSWTMTVPEAQAADAVPVGMLQGTTAKRDISKDDIITYKDVEVDWTSPLAKARRAQEAMLEGSEHL